MDVGKTLLGGGGGEDSLGSVQGRAKKALNSDKIGDVEATTRAAAASMGNPDTATADSARSALSGIKDMALSGGKSLVGDAVGFMSGGGSPASGNLGSMLEGGVSSLASTMTPATPVKEAISLARQ
jgi:hypothetical protein